MIPNGTYNYAVKIRRQLHVYPQIGFDLKRTRQIAEGIDFE